MFKENPLGVHGTVTIDKVAEQDIPAAVKAKMDILTKEQTGRAWSTDGTIQIDNVTELDDNKIQVDFEVV